MMFMYLPNPSAKAEWNRRLIFKQSLTDLNKVFLFLGWLLMYSDQKGEES